MKKILPLFLIAAMSITACQAKTSTSEGTTVENNMSETDVPSVEAYHKISSEEAKEMIDMQSVTIVDVRTKEEYNEGHIENAVLVPNEEITEETPDLLPNKEDTLLIYCRSGRRSKEAADKLVAMGYKNVYDFGGIIDWPYDIVTTE